MIKTLYPKFQEWSEGGSIYIFSDPHFGDDDCKYMAKDWPDPKTHIDAINRYVHKNDTLICLGDCGDPRYFADIKAGRKILIKGNHDDKGDSLYLKCGFTEVYSGPLFIADRILLSHEPVIGLSWCMNIHGHTHGEKGNVWMDIFGGNHCNLAANTVHYGLMNLGDAIKRGMLSDIKTIHRETIDFAIERKMENV